MADDLTPRAQRRGTRVLFVGAAVAAVVLGIAALVWPLLTPTPEHSDPAGVRATQTEGTSIAGRRTTPPAGAGTGAGPESVGRAQSITGSAEPAVDLRPEQVEAIRDFAARQEPVTEVDFSIVVGAAVPEAARLRDIPADLVNVLPSYRGDRYLVVPGRFVIVERHTRRIIAIVRT